MLIDLSAPVTQQQFGDLVGISQPAVSGLVLREVLVEGEPLQAWMLAYCEHLRNMAAGRGSDNSLVLAAERARLAREQADKVAMQNAVTRGELAPAHLIEEVLSKAGARAARILDTIPGLVKRRVPQLSSDDIAAVSAAVAKARNIAADVSLRDLDDDEEEQVPDAATDPIADSESEAA